MALPSPHTSERNERGLAHLCAIEIHAPNFDCDIESDSDGPTPTD